MQKRRHPKQPNNGDQQCAEEALRLRESAELLPPDPIRDTALRKARQLETASHMSEWLSSTELQAPK
jgi:hypothetical protein